MEIEGVIEEDVIFDLDMKDEEVIALVKKKVEKAESFWNSTFKWDKVREKNEKYWLGEQIDKKKLYDHNVPYVENRVFLDIETSNSILNSRTPEPEVFPAQNTETSKKIAEDIEKGLLAHSEKHQIQDKFRFILRHMKLYRIGCLMLRWDEDFGRIGDIVPEYIMPEDLILDPDARPGENPKIGGRYLDQTVEELILKFPDKQEEIFKRLDIQRGTKSQLGKIVRYKEIWFTYYKGGKPQEGVCWMFNDLLLGKMRNPNWVYAEGNEYKKNFLDRPLKPFIYFTYLNLGRHLVGSTSEIEQAIPLQDVLNKRGKQIVENADHANSGWVFGKGFSAEDAELLTGDPDEKIITDSDNVNNTVARFPGAQLPAFVLQDKREARDAIDNMFSVHSVTRGEESSNKTLGQDQLQIQQDMTRQDDLVRCFESGVDQYYKHLLQMMKVYYTEEHMYRINGEDGQFDTVVMKADNIEDGIDVKVKVGSTLPIDKAALRKISMELVGAGLGDPMSLYEDLGLPNARKRMERLLKWKMDPASFADDVRKEKFERDAFMDIQILNRGKMAEPRKGITPEHLEYHTEYMMGREYREAKDEVKQMHVDHVSMETEDLRQTADLRATQLPTDEDVMLANSKTDEANAMSGQQPGQSPIPQQNPTQPQPKVV